MESGLKNVEELDAKTIKKNALKDTSKIQSNNTNNNNNNNSNNKGPSPTSSFTSFPHFSVASHLCPSYSRSSWLALHKEDDVLVRREARAPEVNFRRNFSLFSSVSLSSLCFVLLFLFVLFIIFSFVCSLFLRTFFSYFPSLSSLPSHFFEQAVFFDSEIIKNTDDFITIAERSSIMSSLFDTLFSHFMMKKNKKENDFNNESSNNNMDSINRINNILKMIEKNNEQHNNIKKLFSIVPDGNVQDANVQDLIGGIKALTDLEYFLKNCDDNYENIIMRNNNDKNCNKNIHNNNTKETVENKNNKIETLINNIDNIEKTDKTDKSDKMDFSVIETVSYISLLRAYQRGSPVPLSWVTAMVYKHCMDLTSTGN